MLLLTSGDHAAYQDTFLSQFHKFYPDPFSIFKASWNIIIEFWHLDLSLTDQLLADRYSKFGPTPRLPSCMLRSYLLSIPFFKRHPPKPQHAFSFIFRLYHDQFLSHSVSLGLIDSNHLALAGDGTPVRTSSHLRRKRLCNCWENGITSCRCKRRYSQPDTNSGWDSHREL